MVLLSLLKKVTKIVIKFPHKQRLCKTQRHIRNEHFQHSNNDCPFSKQLDVLWSVFY